MTDTTVTGWTGWGVFASVLLLIAGIFDLIFGLAAIIGPNTTLVVAEAGLFAVDVAGWGWWHIISGVALILTSFFLYRGATWARVVAIILVILNAVGQLTLMSAQPWLVAGDPRRRHPRALRADRARPRAEGQVRQLTR